MAVKHLVAVLIGPDEIEEAERVAIEDGLDDIYFLPAAIVGVKVVPLVFRLNDQFPGETIKTFTFMGVVDETFADVADGPVTNESGIHRLLLFADENSVVHPFPVQVRGLIRYASRLLSMGSAHIQDFELLRAIFVEEGDRDPHQSVIISWNGIRIRDLDGIIILILRIAVFSDILMFTVTEIVFHGHKP